jgi:hypothetical protein
MRDGKYMPDADHYFAYHHTPLHFIVQQLSRLVMASETASVQLCRPHSVSRVRWREARMLKTCQLIEKRSLQDLLVQASAGVPKLNASIMKLEYNRVSRALGYSYRNAPELHLTFAMLRCYPLPMH